jgi:lysophospholipase L1-like esterase
LRKLLFLLIIICVITSGCSIYKSASNDNPTIFVLGDSIAWEYGLVLGKLISNEFNYQIKPGTMTPEDFENPDGNGLNGGNSRMCLKNVQYQQNTHAFTYQYFVLNCGLHDIRKYPDKPDCDVPIEEYCQNLTQIIDILNKNNIPMLWITTTPVNDEIHNSIVKQYKRYNADVIRYNTAAQDIMTKNNIPIIDLYTFTYSLGPDAYRDHVHYTSDAIKQQATFMKNQLYDLL